MEQISTEEDSVLPGHYSDLEAGTGNYVGSLLRYLRDGTITGCYVEGGSVSGDEYVGGLVGYNHGGEATVGYDDIIIVPPGKK